MLRIKTAVLLTVILACIASGVVVGGEFARDRERYPRVRAARAETKVARDSICRAANLEGAAERIYLIGFKSEQELELWGAGSDTTAFRLLKHYEFTGYSGHLGPKRKQGDRQIPEDVYHVDRFNPNSRFHLSLGINYPNKSDHIRGDKTDPGSDIFIHGSNVSIGCIPLGDDAIKELYLFAVDARDAGQRKIPVYLFPFRYDSRRAKSLLHNYNLCCPELTRFWRELQPIFESLAADSCPPTITVDSRGMYRKRD